MTLTSSSPTIKSCIFQNGLATAGAAILIQSSFPVGNLNLVSETTKGHHQHCLSFQSSGACARYCFCSVRCDNYFLQVARFIMPFRLPGLLSIPQVSLAPESKLGVRPATVSDKTAMNIQLTIGSHNLEFLFRTEQCLDRLCDPNWKCQQPDSNWNLLFQLLCKRCHNSTMQFAPTCHPKFQYFLWI